MPIRLNLLAEARAQEELRRRDPVKRAIILGVLLVIVLLVWSSSLQVRKLVLKGRLNGLEAELASHTNAYTRVLANQKKLADMKHRLSCLRRLAAERFLQGSMLNALQQTTVNYVRLTRLRSEQSCTYTPGTAPTKDFHHRIIPGKPATVTENVVVTLDAKDTGPTPGDQVAKFKASVQNCPYFKDLLGKANEVRLASLSPPQAGVGAKAFVPFTLECRLQDLVR